MIKKFILYAVLFVLSGCATVPITGRKQLVFIPASQISAMSETSYRELISQSVLSVNPAEINPVKNSGTKIAAVAEEFLKENGMKGEIQYYKWEFNVIKEDKT